MELRKPVPAQHDIATLRCSSCDRYTSRIEADQRRFFTGRCAECGGELVVDALLHRSAKQSHRAYVQAVLDMPAGPARRAEIRQLLVDLLDVVEQSADERPLIAALKAYDEAANKLRAPLDGRHDAQTSGRPSVSPEVAAGVWGTAATGYRAEAHRLARNRAPSG